MDENAVSTQQAPAGPPPGWYNDPEGNPVQRWWDGTQWTAHSQPLAAVPIQPQDIPAAAPQVSRPGPWAWTIAASPAVSLAVAGVIANAAATPGGSSGPAITIGWLSGCVLGCAAAYMDARQAIRRGEPGSRGLALICLLLSGWAYLLVRAIRSKTSAWWGVFAAGAAAALTAILIIGPVASAAQGAGLTFEQAKVQSAIAAWVKGKTGDAVKVSCPPDPQMTAGSTFTCIATAADGSTAPVDVTVTNNSGSIEWQFGSN